MNDAYVCSAAGFFWRRGVAALLNHHSFGVLNALPQAKDPQPWAVLTLATSFAPVPLAMALGKVAGRRVCDKGESRREPLLKE